MIFSVSGGISNIIAADLDSILKKHIEAVGGREKIERLGSIISYSSIVYQGLPGNQIASIDLPDRYHVEINLGVIKQQSGYDGKIGWSVDPNGKVQQDIAETIKPIINELYIVRFDYALPNNRQGETLYRGDTIIDNRIYHRLDIFPRGGDSVSLFINGTTYLIDYRKEIINGLEAIITYSDFQEFDGLTMAATALVEVPDGGINIEIRTDSTLINVDIPDSVFSMIIVSPDDFLFSDDCDSVTVPFEFSGNKLYLKVKVNGRGPYRFLLDSGAGSNILSRRVADQIGIDITGDIPARGVGGFGSFGFGQIDSLSIGALILKSRQLSVIDFDDIKVGAFGRIDGILGYDFFTRFAVRLDFDSKRLTIYNPRREGLPNLLDTKTGEYRKIEIYGRLPVMEVKVNNFPFRLAIDLGAQVGVIIRNNARHQSDVCPPDRNRLRETHILGIGGEKSVSRVPARLVSIGSFSVKVEEILVSKEDQDFPFPDYIEGLLGVDILKRFNLIIDYPHNRIYFEPRN